MEISTKTKILNVFRSIFKIPVLEKTLAATTSNKSIKSFSAKLIPNNYQYRPETYRVITRNGITFKVDLYDYMGWLIYFGIKDEARPKLYDLLTDKHFIVFDVGTNIGETLLNFAKLVPNGQVHGFEPDKLNYERCCENLSMNSFTNIQLNNVGLGAEAGQYFIKIDTPSNRGGNKISKEFIENNTQVVNIVTLDQYAIDKKLTKIDLIKIDVEGYELHVLKGAVEIIKKAKPIFFIELDDNNLSEQGHSAKELIHFLSEYQYTIRNSETDQIITEQTDFTNCHYDVICKPN